MGKPFEIGQTIAVLDADKMRARKTALRTDIEALSFLLKCLHDNGEVDTPETDSDVHAQLFESAAFECDAHFEKLTADVALLSCEFETIHGRLGIIQKY